MREKLHHDADLGKIHGGGILRLLDTFGVSTDQRKKRNQQFSKRSENMVKYMQK